MNKKNRMGYIAIEAVIVVAMILAAGFASVAAFQNEGIEAVDRLAIMMNSNQKVDIENE
jgi:hypothetical protein